jgi:hypothetical protein
VWVSRRDRTRSCNPGRGVYLILDVLEGGVELTLGLLGLLLALLGLAEGSLHLIQLLLRLPDLLHVAQHGVDQVCARTANKKSFF